MKLGLKQNTKVKRNSKTAFLITVLLGCSAVEYLNDRLNGVDEETAKKNQEKILEGLIERYENLLKEIKDETRDQSKKD